MQIFAELDVGADPFLTPDEFLAHPQMVDNGRVVTVEDPEVGPCRQVGPLALFAGATPFSSRPAPRVGEHNRQVRAELDGPGPEPSPRPARANRPVYPLDGVTILEVAYFLAGPLAATLLAEMGARVVKVEPPGGEPARRLGLQAAKLFHGKESVVLDLKRPDGMAALLELVERADVFLHSFRPGVAERLGIDPVNLLARNRGLVYVYAASYGSEGPQAGRAAFHSTPNALVGSGILQAGRGNPPVDDSYPDPGSALGVATAVLLGLHRRERAAGAGQVVETTMLATTGYAMSPYLVSYDGAPEWRLPDKGQHGVERATAALPGHGGMGLRRLPQREGVAGVDGDIGLGGLVRRSSVRRRGQPERPRRRPGRRPRRHPGDAVCGGVGPASPGPRRSAGGRIGPAEGRLDGRGEASHRG